MNDEVPARPPGAFAHVLQAFAGPLVQPTPPPNILAPVIPDALLGPPRLAHTFQFFASPLRQPPTPAVPVIPVYPNRLPGPPRVAHIFPFFARPVISVGSFPGDGTAGAATLALALEPGAKITFTWGTDIFKSYSGLEQRCNTTGSRPRQRIEGSAFLLDSQDRDLRGALQRAAAAGSTFLVALPYEELIANADSIAQTITVSTTTLCDWAIVTQRVLVWGVDNSTMTGVIQAVTATTIRLDVTPGATGRAGARIMPLIRVLLDSSQGFLRYPVHAHHWSIRALANQFGWVGADSMGRGAQIVTYTTGGPVDVSILTEDDLLIWDRPNLIDGTANDVMLSLAEIVDLGALPFGIGGADVPDWQRPIRYESNLTSEWQWLKAFLRQVLGRQKAFLLPTNRPDLVFVSSAGVALTVQSASVIGAGDYTSWYASRAHRRLALTKTSGAVQYVAVTSLADNHDGTLTLTLDVPITGTIAVMSFLEQVRFDNNDSDDFAVTWDGGTFSVELQARAVQEVLTPPTLIMYDTVINAPFIYAIGNGPPTTMELTINAGPVTYVRFTTNRAPNFGGISVTSSGGVQDGMIVTIVDESSGLGGNLKLTQEDTAWPAADRLLLVGLVSPQIGSNSAHTFVYCGAIQRWVHLLSNRT